MMIHSSISSRELTNIALNLLFEEDREKPNRKRKDSEKSKNYSFSSLYTDTKF